MQWFEAEGVKIGDLPRAELPRMKVIAWAGIIRSAGSIRHAILACLRLL